MLGDLQETRDDEEGGGGVHVGECGKVRGGGWTRADDCYGCGGGREGGYDFLRGNSGGGSCAHVGQVLCSNVPAQVAVGAEHLQRHSVTMSTHRQQHAHCRSRYQQAGVHDGKCQCAVAGVDRSKLRRGGRQGEGVDGALKLQLALHTV